LIERDIYEPRAAEHFEEAQGFVAEILHVVRHPPRDVTNVAALVIERTALPPDAKTVMRPCPEMQYCHSSCSCQCSSRIPPGSMFTSAAAIVDAAGKLIESTMRTQPPSTMIGSCSNRR
jgi:hypothetical protein